MRLPDAWTRLTPAQRGRAVLMVQLAAATLAFFALPIASWVLATPKQTEVTASDYYSDEFLPSFATDGKPATEWLLPDGSLGHLDVRFGRPRTLRRVSLTNGHNGTHMDRAVKKARVVLYDDDDEELERHDVEFPGIEAAHKARVITVRGADVARVRVEVLEFERNGAALAELSFE